jgi:hypothetical protein
LDHLDHLDQCKFDGAFCGPSQSASCGPAWTGQASGQIPHSQGAITAELVGRLAERGNSPFDFRWSVVSSAPVPRRRGVSAAPSGPRRVFPDTFIGPSLDGHVFARTTGKRFPIRKLWGRPVPAEMVKDQTKAAFESVVATELPAIVLTTRSARSCKREAPDGSFQPPTLERPRRARKNSSKNAQKLGGLGGHYGGLRGQ